MEISDGLGQGAVRFAARVFRIAGVWGVLIMTPLYFTFDAVGRAYPPPITHPDLYFGFVGVTLAWQIAFLIIATDPVRYQTFMIAAMLEKGLYLGAMIILYLRGELHVEQAAVVIVPDGTLAVLFAAAWFRLQRASRQPATSRGNIRAAAGIMGDSGRDSRGAGTTSTITQKV